MQSLILYLNQLPLERQAALCARCGTTIGYIRKLTSIAGQLNADVAINFERETGGSVRCETLRPSADWAYVRSTGG